MLSLDLLSFSNSESLTQFADIAKHYDSRFCPEIKCEKGGRLYFKLGQYEKLFVSISSSTYFDHYDLIHSRSEAWEGKKDNILSEIEEDCNKTTRD
mmetsp:Transcript_5719/g.4887  ORF Transcript_5719/g.4887 Transcript_5719/m.4887 type:complete len:96 (+) Transcript_5719:1191-1478(+)